MQFWLINLLNHHINLGVNFSFGTSLSFCEDSHGRFHSSFEASPSPETCQMIEESKCGEIFTMRQAVFPSLPLATPQSASVFELVGS